MTSGRSIRDARLRARTRPARHAAMRRGYQTYALRHATNCRLLFAIAACRHIRATLSYVTRRCAPDFFDDAAAMASHIRAIRR